jgi:hypothetical protein
VAVNIFIKPLAVGGTTMSDFLFAPLFAALSIGVRRLLIERKLLA